MGSAPVATVETYGPEEFATYRYRRHIGVKDIRFQPRISSDLQTWSGDSADLIFVGSTNNDDGTATMTFRSAAPTGNANAREFFELEIQSAP